MPKGCPRCGKPRFPRHLPRSHPFASLSLGPAATASDEQGSLLLPAQPGAREAEQGKRMILHRSSIVKGTFSLRRTFHARTREASACGSHPDVTAQTEAERWPADCACTQRVPFSRSKRRLTC